MGLEAWKRLLRDVRRKLLRSNVELSELDVKDFSLEGERPTTEDYLPLYEKLRGKEVESAEQKRVQEAWRWLQKLWGAALGAICTNEERTRQLRTDWNDAVQPAAKHKYKGDPSKTGPMDEDLAKLLITDLFQYNETKTMQWLAEQYPQLTPMKFPN